MSPVSLCVRLRRRNEIDAFLRLFFHASNPACCYGEATGEWEEVIWVTQQHLPSYSRARQSQVHNLEQREVPSHGTLVLVHGV